MTALLSRIRRRLRPLALWFTRSSHRELLTAALQPRINLLRGVVIDVGGGRNSPLASYWPQETHRIRVDISGRFSPHVLGDAQELPMRSCSVDGAVLSEVLEHIPRPAEAIAEIHRVLRSGAWLHGSVPFAIGIHADPYDYYRYTSGSLELLLSDFDIVDVQPHGNHLAVAWRAVNERWHWLWIINPLVRPLGRRTDPRWPVGYTFAARKATADETTGLHRCE
jgi:SAM-dependent methyltransferase